MSLLVHGSSRSHTLTTSVAGLYASTMDYRDVITIEG